MRKFILIAALSLASMSAQAGMVTANSDQPFAPEITKAGRPAQADAKSDNVKSASVKPAEAMPGERRSFRRAQYGQQRPVSLKTKIRYGYIKFKSNVRRSFARAFGR